MNTIKEVKCEECKHKIDIIDAQAIEYEKSMGSTTTTYYCPMHKKAYEKVVYYGIFDRYGSHGRRYMKMCEVNSDGTPITYPQYMPLVKNLQSVFHSFPEFWIVLLITAAVIAAISFRSLIN